MKKIYFEMTYRPGLHDFLIYFSRVHTSGYNRKPGSPSALRCARLLAKIAESEAKQ